MKKTIVSVALTLTACLGAQEVTTKVTARVTVCLDGYIDPVVAAQAKVTASEMFARIGVKIEWQGSSRPGRPATALWSRQDAIRISFRTGTPIALLPGAVARAWPYEGGRIEVFYDRVQGIVEPEAVGTLLAHVFVHEISHVLQRVVSHSDSGVMKASWDSADYANMKWVPLPFTEEDVVLIQRGLRMNLQAERSPSVTIYVKGDGAPPPLVDYAARADVTRMFARVGIRLAWRNGAVRANVPSGNTVYIQVQFAGDSPNNASPTALAFAMPFGAGATAITVMYQRLRAAARKSAREQSILAHVLAHEIGHVLQRTIRHAHTGVMKAHWTALDLDAMTRKPLEFTMDDVDLMVRGLATLKAGTIR